MEENGGQGDEEGIRGKRPDKQGHRYPEIVSLRGTRVAMVVT